VVVVVGVVVAVVVVRNFSIHAGVRIVCPVTVIQLIQSIVVSI